MPRENLLTHSGNRITVTIDGLIVGLMQSVRVSDSYGLEDASGIGDIHVIEHVPSKAVHQVSVSNMALFTNNLRAVLGPLAENGDGAMLGLVFDINVMRKDTGQLLRQIIGCSYDSGDIDVTAHRIVVQSGQFKALDVRELGL